MLELLFLFIAYSVIGWIWETSYVSVKQKHYVNRGFLHGPYVTIYGMACITIMASMSMFAGFENTNSICVIFLQILYIAIVTSVWEYATSYILEQKFKARWWDYSYRKFNINGRIAPFSTLFFAIGGYLLWRFLNPLLLEIYGGINSEVMMFILIGFYFVYLIDAIIIFIQLNKLSNIIIALSQVKDKISLKYKNLSIKAERFKKFFKKYPNAKSKKFKEHFEQVKENIYNKVKK